MMGAVRAVVREPAVAGLFYPEDPVALRAMVQQLLPRGVTPAPAIGVVSPHAGYQYSGAVAGAVLGRVVVPEQVILLGPNHTGCGAPFSIMAHGRWRTPLGSVPVDTALAEAILEAAGVLEEDDEAHRQEHAIEAQLPFLQRLQPGLRMVPITLAGNALETYRRLGRGMAEVLRRAPQPILLVASSDMTHYEPQAVAQAKDRLAIEPIVQVDAEGLFRTVMTQEISMCGYAPTVAMLVAAKALGATRGALVAYQTSGDTTGDQTSVVGYAGLIVDREAARHG